MLVKNSNQITDNRCLSKIPIKSLITDACPIYHLHFIVEACINFFLPGFLAEQKLTNRRICYLITSSSFPVVSPEQTNNFAHYWPRGSFPGRFPDLEMVVGLISFISLPAGLSGLFPDSIIDATCTKLAIVLPL